MKAVQLTTSGDYFSHYLIDDHSQWEREIKIHQGLSLERLEYNDVTGAGAGARRGGCGGVRMRAEPSGRVGGEVASQP